VTNGFRVARIVRLFSMIKDLWMVALTFLHTLQPLFWTVMFVLVVVFIFSIVIVSVAPQGGVYAEPLVVMRALIQIMTLDEWVMEVDAIIDESTFPQWALYLIFILFISVSALALMNLVTAIVIESAQKKTHAEEEVKRILQAHEIALIKLEMTDLVTKLDELRIFVKLPKHMFWDAAE
jgi:hypothetical protein